MSAPRGAIAVRLSAHYEPATIDLESHEAWLIATLLEEGDSRDLRWLVERCGRDRLAVWVATRGRRQLSARSLAFWCLVLTVENPPTGPGEALWPA